MKHMGFIISISALKIGNNIYIYLYIYIYIYLWKICGELSLRRILGPNFFIYIRNRYDDVVMITPIHRLPRLRIGERPLDIMVSCE